MHIITLYCSLKRLNANAMGLLNLLTAYQKKHLVEFLPYHECDTQSRQAPDLECLIKLQAQNIQQRHLIFLTGIFILIPVDFGYISPPTFCMLESQCFSLMHYH